MKAKYIAISAAIIATVSGVSYASLPNSPVQMVSDEPTTTEVQPEVVETQPVEQVETTPTESTPTQEQPATEQANSGTPTQTPTQTSQPTQAPAASAPAPQQPAATQEPAPTPPPAPKIVSKTMHYVDINATQQDGYCTYVWSDGHVAVQRIGTRQTPGNGVMHIELNCFSSYR